MTLFHVPKSTSSAELDVKKSRFVAYVGYAQSRQDALAFVENIKSKHPDGRHHCWAYIEGSPHSSSSAGMSDDGEPSGTAGKPMLNVLQHKKLGNVVAVVVRYFGGIKLGAGGLVRAYGGSVQKAIENLDVEAMKPLESWELTFPYEYENTVRHLITQSGGMLFQVNYHESILMSVKWESIYTDELKKTLTSATRGEIKLRPIRNDLPFS